MKKIFLNVFFYLAIVLAPLVNIVGIAYMTYTQFFYWPTFELDKDYKCDSLWPEKCWVKSLDKLNELRNNPNIEEMWCIGGKLNTGHMWIAYKTKNHKLVIYDPVYNRTKIKDIK